MHVHTLTLFVIAQGMLLTAIPVHAGQRYAVVIGIDGYRALDKLTSCVADAEAVAKVLEESGGFSKVIRLTDRAAEADRPTFATVRRRIEHVAKAAEKGDTVLLFFSGHGVERGGAGYLVPIDGDFDNAVPLAWVNEQLEKSAATTKVAIFDCCHAGAKGVPGIRPSLTSAVMLLSCSKGELSHNDEASGHGVFTRYLVEGLRGAADGADESAKDSQVTVSELYRYVRKHVVDWSLAQGKKQTPLCLPEEGSGVALVRLKSIEELQKEREALKRSLDATHEAGREEVVKALREEIARLEARLSALGAGGGDVDGAVKRFRDLRALLDETLKTHQPTSTAATKIQAELIPAAKKVCSLIEPLLESKRAAYRDLTKELLPTAPKMVALQEEIDALREILGESLPYLGDDEVRRTVRTSGAPLFRRWPFGAAEAKQRQELTAKGLGVKVEEDVNLGGGVKLTLVLIPPGEFRLGEGRMPEPKRIRIEHSFWMGKCEITQKQWEVVIGSNPSHFKGTENPVEQVSWNDIQHFLRKLNAGQKGGGVALPTEAEWEYACRAGTTTRFCFGDDQRKLSEYTWLVGSDNPTHPVGQKLANAWGLHDMHGNVWEWCASPYAEAYDGTESKGADAQGEVRVVRGGNWSFSPSPGVSSARDPVQDYFRFKSGGFRVVRLAAGP